MYIDANINAFSLSGGARYAALAQSTSFSALASLPASATVGSVCLEVNADINAFVLSGGARYFAFAIHTNVATFAGLIASATVGSIC